MRPLTQGCSEGLAGAGRVGGILVATVNPPTPTPVFLFLVEGPASLPQAGKLETQTHSPLLPDPQWAGLIFSRIPFLSPFL